MSQAWSNHTQWSYTKECQPCKPRLSGEWWAQRDPRGSPRHQEEHEARGHRKPDDVTGDVYPHQWAWHDGWLHLLSKSQLTSEWYQRQIGVVGVVTIYDIRAFSNISHLGNLAVRSRSNPWHLRAWEPRKDGHLWLDYQQWVGWVKMYINDAKLPGISNFAALKVNLVASCT